jgi:hypothetical protein
MGIFFDAIDRLDTRTPEQKEADEKRFAERERKYAEERRLEREAFLAAAPLYRCDGEDARSRYMLGRLRNGCERDSGTLYHVVKASTWRALCGAKPGDRSVGWSPAQDRPANCPRCLKRFIPDR